MKLISLTANFESFRSFDLNASSSFIVAERQKEATRTDSRNGLGKSSAIAIIDFCLGANASRQVESTVGRGWEFTLTLVANNGAVISVTRSPDQSADVVITGERARVGLTDPNTADDQPLTIGKNQWTSWLASSAFPSRAIEGRQPTWRSLIRHFVRYRNEAFIDPFRTTKSPAAQQIQAENAYLLGLDWNLAAEWSQLRADLKRLSALDVEDVTLDEKIASTESQLAKGNARLSMLSDEVGAFSIVPEYAAVERRANRTTRAIKDLTNEIIADQQMISMYEGRLETESSADETDITTIFAEAGVLLGDAVKRSLQDAASFHSQVAANRTQYLADEIVRLRGAIRARENERDMLDREQQDAMLILKSGGALEDFAELQRRVAEAQADVTYLQNELADLNRIAEKRSRLKSDEVDLATRTRRDLNERFSQRQGILTRFSKILEELYGEDADLQVTVGRNRAGLQLKTKLPRGGSDGVDRMAIFAYNIAVSEAFAKDGIGPGFLIHDSLAFADVDERQVAQAIQIAVKSAADFGYQYIATLNSDKIPWADLKEPSIVTDNVVLTLNDATPQGSLFGTRISAESDDSDDEDDA